MLLGPRSPLYVQAKNSHNKGQGSRIDKYGQLRTLSTVSTKIIYLLRAYFLLEVEVEVVGSRLS